MTQLKIFGSIVVGISASVLILDRVLNLSSVGAEALDINTVYYVAPSCTSVPTPCFTSIQAAVDAVDEPTDVIKVASGTYTDVHAHPRRRIN